MTLFLNNKQARDRITELCAEIEANGGSAPQNCGGFQTSREATAEIAKMENILAECRLRKSKAAPGTPALIACLSEKTTGPTPAAVRVAVQARLYAGKAALAAAEAKVRAKQAAAAIQPGATVTAAEFGTKPLRMSRAEFGKLNPADRARFLREGNQLI